MHVDHSAQPVNNAHMQNVVQEAKQLMESSTCSAAVVSVVDVSRVGAARVKPSIKSRMSYRS